MRIVLTIHHRPEPDTGAYGSICRLAEEYRRAGHEVSVLSYGDLPRGLSERAGNLVFPWYLRHKLAREVRRRPVEVIDASSGDAWVWAGSRRRRDGPLLVTHTHGLEHTAHEQLMESVRRGEARLSWRYPLYHGGYRLGEVARSLRRADLGFFLNRLDLDYATASLGVDPGRARLVFNGIPQSLLDQTGDRIAGAPPHIAWIGRWSERKGKIQGRPALERLLKQFPTLRLGLFGVGMPAERILAEFDPAVRSRIDARPAFANADLPDLLRDYGIIAFPSLSEGHSLAQIEGMACGLAPVTTNPVAAPEIADGENSLVVPLRDTDALAAALARLVADDSLRMRLASAARRAAAGFTWQRAAARRLALYEEFTDRRKAGRDNR